MIRHRDLFCSPQLLYCELPFCGAGFTGINGYNANRRGKFLTTFLGNQLGNRRPTLSHKPGWKIRKSSQDYHSSHVFNENLGEVGDVTRGYDFARCSLATVASPWLSRTTSGGPWGLNLLRVAQIMLNYKSQSWIPCKTKSQFFSFRWWVYFVNSYHLFIFFPVYDREDIYLIPPNQPRFCQQSWAPFTSSPWAVLKGGLLQLATRTGLEPLKHKRLGTTPDFATFFHQPRFLNPGSTLTWFQM